MEKGNYQFEVHAAGCRDIKRSEQNASSGSFVLEYENSAVLLADQLRDLNSNEPENPAWFPEHFKLHDCCNTNPKPTQGGKMKAVKWTQEQLAEIAALVETRNLTRKSAVQFYRRGLKKAAAAPARDFVKVPGLGAIEIVSAPAKPAKVKPARNVSVAVARAAKASTAKPAAPNAARKTWATEHMQKVVALYAKGTGMSVPDIAEKMGDRNKQNRIRQALTLAGVYQK